MTLKVYGIKNCNTVKKALEWLKSNNIAYDFHDFKTKGITQVILKKWISKTPFEKLINKKGTTYRQLEPSEIMQLSEKVSALKLIETKPTLIKRPVLEMNDQIIFLGFDENEYNQIFL